MVHSCMEVGIIAKGSKMSERAYVRVQAQQKAFTGLPARVLQRTCACGKHTLAGGECEECRKKREGTLQRAALRSSSIDAVPPVVHEALRAPGQPLDAATRTFMEPRFGRDFSNVRVHTDAKAAESARAVNALAYTVGHDVVFGTQQYASLASEGRKLIAHELTHTIQQHEQAASLQRLTIGEPDSQYEQEADRVAGTVTQRPEPAPFPGIVPQRTMVGTLQRDVAIEPVASEAGTPLSHGEIVGALAHNQRWFTDHTLIANIRDLLGISRTPAVIDEEFVLAVARWQAANGITQDGRIGRITKIYLAQEFEAEGLPLIAQQLRGLVPSSHVVDIDSSFCGCQQKLSDSIQDNLDFITEYQTCRNNPHNHTGDQIENCVTAAFAAHGISLSTAGTTSSAGQIQVAPVAGHCGALTSSETFAHEWSHSTHQRDLVRRFGSGTPAFEHAWNESTDWADDEIRARVVGNNFLLWLIARLNQACTHPTSP